MKNKKMFAVFRSKHAMYPEAIFSTAEEAKELVTFNNDLSRRSSSHYHSIQIHNQFNNFNK